MKLYNENFIVFT